MGQRSSRLERGIVALGVKAAIEGELPTLGDLGTMPGVPEYGWLGVFAAVLLVNGYGEEVGWRGFAWSRLRLRYGHASSALVLALVWAGWHLPAFWLDTGLRGLEPLVIPGWIVGLAAGAVVLGWLYDRARSSLLIVAIFHAFSTWPAPPGPRRASRQQP
jgi:membrane protease YdiL (CAAX protease family)